MTKRYFFSIFLLLLFCTAVGAQNISVTDFQFDEMDVTANQEGTIVYDQNGEKCALIKVRTTETGFNFDVGSLGVTEVMQKTAEIWVYVPHGVRRLNISHQKYGQLDYQFPVAIQKSKTYLLSLKADTPLPVDHQRLTIKCQPKTTVVSIDGNMVDMKNGKGEITLPLGSHKYLAMANGYYQTDGTINLVAERPGRLSIDLEPKEGTSQSEEEETENKPKFSITKTQNGFSCKIKYIEFEMIRVEGGTFTMGTTSEQDFEASQDEQPAHMTTIGNYYIGKYEVSQTLWKEIMGSNPSLFRGDNLPVESVSWNDCNLFIQKLNFLTGKKFRLPTEAEWEYACRGGKQGQGYIYSGSNELDNVAWYGGNSEKSTHEVGTKSPNELGVYDMNGNVWEWCQDRKGNYLETPQNNPTGPASGTNRVFRGGCYGSKARYCRSTARNGESPESRGDYVGLRLALSE